MKFQIMDSEGWHAHTKNVFDKNGFGNARYEEEISLVGDTKAFHVWYPCEVLLIFIN